MDEADTTWLDGFLEEFTNSFDVIDDSTVAPAFVESKDAQQVAEANAPCASVTNKLISTVYSGPTISDIESALSIRFRCGTDGDRSSYPPPSVLLPEKGIGKAEDKYTLRVKSCGATLADDGYKWRKYGQKSIKNSPNPRSYYRCTNPRCNAKKQVEKSTEDPYTLIVTYEGLHLHYTYSHLLQPKPKDSPSTTADLHMPKKRKCTGTNPVAPQVAGPKKQSRAVETNNTPDEQQQEQTPEKSSGEGARITQEWFVTNGSVADDHHHHHEVDRQQSGLMFSDEHSPRGLLEDVVPWLVRKPCSSITSSNEQSTSYSQASSPSYSSSLSSWSPNYCFLDAAILSDIITSL